MPITAPDTESIFNSLTDLITPLKLKDGVTPAYNSVIVGAVEDYTQIVLPACNIQIIDDDSMRHAHGGTIVEPQGFRIRSVIDYVNQSKQAAEIQLVNVRDALMPLLEKYAVLPNTTTVYHSAIKKGSARPGYLFLKPNWYRAHEVILLVAQYYVIQGGIQ